MFYVTIYETNQAYGGPEEGGWYYSCGHPCQRHLDFQQTFDTEEKALEYRDSLKDVLARLNEEEDNRPTSSVLCDGWLEAYVTEGLPRPFPEKRPYYE